MADSPLDELIEELEGISIRTSQGSYLKMEDVRRVIEKKKTADEEQSTEPKPKNVYEAREQAKRFLDGQGFGQKQPAEPGKAVPATEPQPSSRT